MDKGPIHRGEKDGTMNSMRCISDDAEHAVTRSVKIEAELEKTLIIEPEKFHFEGKSDNIGIRPRLTQGKIKQGK